MIGFSCHYSFFCLTQTFCITVNIKCLGRVVNLAPRSVFDVQLRVLLDKCKNGRFGMLAGVVVYQNDFFLNAVDQAYTNYLLEDKLDGVALIVCRDDN